MGEQRIRCKNKIRRILKLLISKLVLAPYYHLCCLRPIQKNLVVLADGHQNAMPYSMAAMSDRLHQIPGIAVKEYYHDYSFCGAARGLVTMLRFMPLYARARYVFLSDCFLPSSCCKKRHGTTLIQLWHSAGLMKKVGLDSPEDAAGMIGNQYRNTDVFTASSDVVADVLSGAMRIPRQAFSGAGVTRMDLLFDEARNANLRKLFLAQYPQYIGKKILLWAPTFRGSVHAGYLLGQAEIARLQQTLPPDYAVIIKTHRFSNSGAINTQVQYSTELLLPIVDAIITDYSSVYFDYLYFRKPIILFAPDLESYLSRRGLYPDYEQMPGKHAKNFDELYDAALHLDKWADAAYHRQLDELWDAQMSDCDGHSCEKLLRQLGLLPEADAPL